MRIRRIDDHFTVSTQIELDRMKKLATSGYRSIICNRPDGESATYPPFRAVKHAAERNGIQAAHIPVGLGGASEADHAAFAEAIRRMEPPFLVYCRSGNRSAMLILSYLRKCAA